MSLLPSSPDVSPDSDPRLVGLDSDEAGELMAALSSETARRLLAELHEDPAPPGELADRVGTSLQNAQYHLEKLENAGAIEVVGTAYSEKGREMAVYGPADSPLVIYAGEQERASGLRAALSRLFAGLLALAVGSVAIQELFGRSLLGGAGSGSDGAEGGNGADGAEDGPGNGDGDVQPSAETRDDTETSASGGGASDGDVQPASGEMEETDTGTAASEDDFSADEASPTPEATETPAPEATGTAEPTGTSASTPTKTEELTQTPTATAEPTTTPTDGGAADNALNVLFDGLFGGGLPPGVAFFVGGLTVLSVVVAMTYLRAQP